MATISLIHTLDPFQLLPVEIMLEIMESIGEFHGLVSLLKASPYARSVCEKYALPILNNLTSSYSLLHCPPNIWQDAAYKEAPHSTNALFCMMDILLSGPPSDIETAKRTLNSLAYCAWTSSPTFIPSQRARVVAMDLMHIGARIQRLWCLCLTTMADKLHRAISNSKSIKNAEEIIPFSWVEEYRVFQALWFLYLYSTHSSYLQQMSLVLTADKIGITYGSEMGRFRYLIMKRYKPKWEEVRTVIATLVQLGVPRVKTKTASQCLTLDVPQFDFEGIEEILNHGNFPSHVWSPPPVPEKIYPNKSWGRDMEAAFFSRAFATCEWEDVLYAAYQRHEESDSTWSPFRELPELTTFCELGVFVWDDWRMYSSAILTPRLMQLRDALTRVGPPDDSVEVTDDREHMESIARMESFSNWWSLVEDGKE